LQLLGTTLILLNVIEYALAKLLMTVLIIK